MGGIINNSGTFDAPTTLQLASGNKPGCIGIGDINGDNFNDLIVLDPWNKQLVIYTQDISGAFNSPFLINSGGSISLSGAIEIKDMNQDDLADIVFLNPYGGLAIHLQNGKGGFDVPIIFKWKCI